MKTFLYLAAATSALIASGQAQAATFFSASGDGFIIPFGVNTQTSTATVGTSGTITSLTFTLDLLVHTSARDLAATVTHNGITADLFSDLQCCRGLLGEYLFSSSASTPLADADGWLIYQPGTYSFSYTDPATSFLGGNAAGDWTLSVADDRKLGIGALSGWSVSGKVTSPPVTAPVPEPASWTMMIAGFGLVGAAMRRNAYRTRTKVRYAA